MPLFYIVISSCQTTHESQQNVEQNPFSFWDGFVGDQVPGTRHLVPRTYLVRYQVPGPRCQAPGSWYQVPGTRFQGSSPGSGSPSFLIARRIRNDSVYLTQAKYPAATN